MLRMPNVASSEVVQVWFYRERDAENLSWYNLITSHKLWQPISCNCLSPDKCMSVMFGQMKDVGFYQVNLYEFAVENFF